jgi:iron complex transport system substrate-binding protein
MSSIPQRIICLSAEAADWLWRIGVWENVVGVTAFFNLPPKAAAKPRVSGFNSANREQIERLNPDLIVTFSDVQADLAADLICRGFSVLATNQRTLAEVEATLALLARIVDREHEGEKLLAEFRTQLAPVKPTVSRPRTYFEEWNDPLISGIAWVSELVELAGGNDIFPELRTKRAARERVISQERVCAAAPEIIFASWCGQPVQVGEITARPGWKDIPAVRGNHIYEISSNDILQPGFQLIYGYEKIKQYLQSFSCGIAHLH